MISIDAKGQNAYGGRTGILLNLQLFKSFLQEESKPDSLLLQIEGEDIPTILQCYTPHMQNIPSFSGLISPEQGFRRFRRISGFRNPIKRQKKHLKYQLYTFLAQLITILDFSFISIQGREATLTAQPKYNCSQYFETEHSQLHALFSQLQDSFILNKKQIREKSKPPFQWADAHSLHEKFPPSKSLQRDTCLLPMDYGINMKAQCKSNASIIYSNLAHCAVFQCSLISHNATNSVWKFWIPYHQLLQANFKYSNILPEQKLPNLHGCGGKAKNLPLLDNLTAKISSAHLCF